MRPMMSVPPPAACELMNLIGRSGQLCDMVCGQLCAAAKLQGMDSAIDTSSQRKLLLIGVSRRLMRPGFMACLELTGAETSPIDWPRAARWRGLSWGRDLPRISPMNVLTNLPRPAWMTEDLVLLEEQARR